MRVPYSNHSDCLTVCWWILVDAAVARVLKLPYPNWMHGLPMGCRCALARNFGPVTSDLEAMTLNLGILWTLLCVRYWCQAGQFVPVDYPWGVVVHAHGILVLWLLTLAPWTLTLVVWPWPPLAGPLLTWSVFSLNIVNSSYNQKFLCIPYSFE